MKIAMTVGALALAMGMSSGQARAAEISTDVGVTSTNNCQNFLPGQGATTRSRPLGIKNDSTSANATVVCAWPWDPSVSVTGIDYVTAYFTNAGTAAATVNCTFVVGYEGGTVSYTAKSAALTASGGSNNVELTAADFPSQGYIGDLVSLSCSLPPSVTMNDTALGDTADYSGESQSLRSGSIR